MPEVWALGERLMAKLSKRIKVLESIDQSKAYNMQEAFKIIKENSKVKFNESVDVSINLGIDAKKLIKM